MDYGRGLTFSRRRTIIVPHAALLVKPSVQKNPHRGAFPPWGRRGGILRGELQPSATAKRGRSVRGAGRAQEGTPPQVWRRVPDMRPTVPAACRGGVRASVASDTEGVALLLDISDRIPSHNRPVMRSYNCQVKYWADHDGVFHPYEMMAFNRPVYGAPTGKQKKKVCSFSVDTPPPLEGGAPRCDRDNIAESRRRALRSCRDLGCCNPDLNIFATFTLDGAKIDRYNYGGIIGAMNTWLDNRVRRNGLKYLIVPELHKDGAIHFHGLLNDVLDRRPAGVKHHGKCVYNLPDWTLGFTTAQRITGKDCVRKTTEYVLKYITKSADKVGGRYYLHGGKFDKPRTACYNVDMSLIPGQAFEVAPGIEVACTRNELTISELLTKIHAKEATEDQSGIYFSTGVENSLFPDEL